MSHSNYFKFASQVVFYTENLSCLVILKFLIFEIKEMFESIETCCHFRRRYNVQLSLLSSWGRKNHRIGRNKSLSAIWINKVCIIRRISVLNSIVITSMDKNGSNITKDYKSKAKVMTAKMLKFLKRSECIFNKMPQYFQHQKHWSVTSKDSVEVWSLEIVVWFLSEWHADAEFTHLFCMEFNIFGTEDCHSNNVWSCKMATTSSHF